MRDSEKPSSEETKRDGRKVFNVETETAERQREREAEETKRKEM